MQSRREISELVVAGKMRVALGSLWRKRVQQFDIGKFPVRYRLNVRYHQVQTVSSSLEHSPFTPELVVTSLERTLSILFCLFYSRLAGNLTRGATFSSRVPVERLVQFCSVQDAVDGLQEHYGP